MPYGEFAWHYDAVIPWQGESISSKQQSGSASVTPFAGAKIAPAAIGCCFGRYVTGTNLQGGVGYSVTA
jgi:hypothetical protein